MVGDGELYDTEIAEFGFIDTLLHQYLLSFGDFSTDDYGTYGKTNAGFNWVYFVSATLFINLVIFNMLIAVMGDTYDKVYENKDKSVLQEKLNVMKDYTFLFKN